MIHCDTHISARNARSSQNKSHDFTESILNTTYVKGVVQNFGHRASFPSQPVCYLSLETFSTNFMQSF